MNWSNEWTAPGKPIFKLPDDEPRIVGHKPASIWPHNVTFQVIVNEGDFPTPVEAIQVGDLAVHENLRKEGYWQVTHVPTLTRFNVIHGGLHRKSDLIEWCKTVQAQLQDDWKELASLTTETYKSRSDAKDRIMNLCQGTPV